MRDIVKVKLDTVFKRLFADKKNEKILTSFISAILDIPKSDIKSIVVENPEIPPDSIADKFCHLDIRLTLNDSVVNLEIQIENEGFYEDRATFNWAKLYAAELKRGEDYSQLKKSISINIINFNLFQCKDFHSEFNIMERNRHSLLTDKCEIHFFELKKIGKEPNLNNLKELWMQFINAESEEELKMLEATNVKEIQDAVVIVKEMSADDKIREEARMREKTLHDRATALKTAELRGRSARDVEIIANMRAQGFDEDTIARVVNI